MSCLTQLQLAHFRCYESARIEDLRPGLVVLHGPNGAGKTNILEAVSLLTPGRGLRGAAMTEVQRRDSPAPWAIAAQVDTGGAAVQLGTGLEPETGRRAVRVNGVPAKSQIALADYLSCLWLTPQMDRLFIDGASGRRRFLDKLVFTADPGHAGRVTRYENAMSQRSKLLRDGGADPGWLDGLERQMAETGMAITAARMDFARRLQKGIASVEAEEEKFFPKAQIDTTGTLESLLRESPAVEVEALFTYQLRESRRRDAETGGAATGPHKSDLAVRFAAKDMPADQCSTGEQKALLIGLVLSHARLMAAETGGVPVLLLDEIAAHLDEARRAALFDRLRHIGGQVFMTGTDKNLFDAAGETAQFFSVELARIHG